MTTIYHPDTQGIVDVPEESVAILRQAGWVTRDEWQESQALAETRRVEAERAAQEAQRAEQKVARSTAAGHAAAKEK